MSYNMAAKERPLSDLSMRLRLKWWKHYTFNMNAVFATYAYELDKNGNVFVGDHTEYSQGRFGRFQGMSQTYSYTFNNQSIQKLLGMKVKVPGRRDKSDEDDEDEFEDDEADPTMQNVDPDRRKGMNGAPILTERTETRRNSQ